MGVATRFQESCRLQQKQQKTPEGFPPGAFNFMSVGRSHAPSVERRDIGAGRSAQTGQVMSCPQHMGDFTLPCPSGHSETCTTVLPSGIVIVLCLSSLPHLPQVMMPMLMPHLLHV
jgi:hypothetical protein